MWAEMWADTPGGASDFRRDYHFTEYAEEAAHKQAERDLQLFRYCSGRDSAPRCPQRVQRRNG